VTTYKAVKVAGTRSSDFVAVFGVGGLGHLAIQYAAIAGGRVDQAIALAVSPRAFEQAYSSLRRGGTLVFVALPADNKITLPIFETVLNGITIVGSIVGTRQDLREVFELHAAGKTSVIRETRPLEEVNEAIADVEAGRVAARNRARALTSVTMGLRPYRDRPVSRMGWLCSSGNVVADVRRAGRRSCPPARRSHRPVDLPCRPAARRSPGRWRSARNSLRRRGRQCRNSQARALPLPESKLRNEPAAPTIVSEVRSATVCGSVQRRAKYAVRTPTLAR
jgi:hypothetical protein